MLGVLLVLSALGDQAAARWAATLPPTVRDFAKVVTGFGTSGYMFAGSALVAAVAWWMGRATADADRRARLARVVDRALFFFIVIAASGVAAQVLKHAAGRPRPRFAGEGGPFTFHPFSIANSLASFPSGHATSAFAAAAALGLMLPRGRPALFLLAFAIGASRVLVHEHYPSDVVGGAALGLGVALLLARARWTSVAIPAARAWTDRAAGPFVEALSGRAGAWTLAAGSFLVRHRRWHLPVLAAGCFAIAIPPSDLFGSETAEHVKDGCAILIALAGLSVRAAVVGFGQTGCGASGLSTDGLPSLCRNPLYLGNIMVLTGIFLMHGNRWTVLLGTGATVLIHMAVVRAEEDSLSAAFGPAYADYARRVPRWLPDVARLVPALSGRPFDLRRVRDAEYPHIGLTVIALALAEFYEEIQEPLIRSRMTYLDILLMVMAGTLVGIGGMWVAKNRRWVLE